MLLAADYPLLEVVWTLLVFSGLVIWLRLLFTVFADLFRRHDVSGWGKAGWMLVTIVLPFVGVFVYLGMHGPGIAQRNAEQMKAAQAQFDDYVRDVAGPSKGSVAEIAEAKRLLDSGAISQAEYDAIKQRTLA